jgi:hypothetical protein
LSGNVIPKLTEPKQIGASDVNASRLRRRAAGWHALLNTHKITGLNMSFGTKLL